MKDSSADDSILVGLAEEFANRYRRGERPSLTEYTDKYPQLAGQIRELFPAMAMIERFGSVAGPPTGPYTKTVTEDGTVPKKLGEYRILREVSRGGMGIVYEAVQESLGRHVALKVLPFQSLADANHLERFRREARAAANLHHTNIVPVFGVGEHQGIHYYAMQFIQGQSLANVLGELKQMKRRNRGQGTGVRGQESGVGSQGKECGAEITASLAGGLLTGRFVDQTKENLKDDRFASGGNPASEPTDRNRNGKADSVTGCSRSRETSDDAAWQKSHDFCYSSQPDFQYFRSVSRVGIQIAEALAYAHQQGILHRDIKPSNLLLDTNGTLWVTDFGLAKAADSDDLTRTGDIVGTVRYMAPERFQGKADPRNDIYGLGITLYEMLTLQPAFEDTDRARLIERVAREEPSRPRKIDPRIPRDLETIVLKAIAKEPGRRYATAEAMAEDLRRFLADRPIRARRASSLEKAWRWCRRNPVDAVLMGSVAALVLALTIGLSVALLLRKERNEALANLERAESAEQRLYDEHNLAMASGHLAAARAARWSGKVGQRFTSLEELAAAAERQPSPELRLELRNEAIACLTLTDLRLAKSWDGFPTGTKCLAFDSEVKHYARSDSRGNISVRTVEEDRKVASLEGPGTHAYVLKFSPDGKFLAAIYHKLQPTGLYIWDLGRSKEILCLALRGGMDFSPDSRRVVVGDHGSVRFYDLASGKEEKRLTMGQGDYAFAFDPTGRLIAVANTNPNCVQIFDLIANKVMMTFPNQYLPSWSSDGRLLATGCSDERIYIWDALSGKQRQVLSGHDSLGTVFAFNHRGDLLASTSWDGTLRLWDALTGRQLLSKEGGRSNVLPQFSSNDQLLACTTKGSKIELWEVATGSVVCQTFTRPSDYVIDWTDLSPDGRLLASASGDGVRLWDLHADREAAFLPIGVTRSVFFHPTEGALITSGDRGVFRWPINPNSSPPNEEIQVGPPERLGQSGGTWDACLDRDGHKLAVAERNRGRGLVLDLGKKNESILLGNHPNIARIAISPDDRWVATATWWGDNSVTKIWDARSGRLVRDLPAQILEGDATVAFSPDGRWLVTGGRGYRFWEVGSWEPGRFIEKEHDSFGAMAFSWDGKILAILKSSRYVQLIDVDTGSELAGFEASQNITHLCFSLDGSRLAAGCSHQVTHVWDLQAMRRELAEMGLDWDMPPYLPRDPWDDARALRIKVDLGQASQSLGMDLLQPREQIGLCSFLLALNPFNYQTYMDRGSAYTKLGEWSKAIDDLSLALALMPSDPKPRALALIRRAYNYSQIKEFTRSLADLQLALKLYPNNLQACNNLAWLYVTGPENMRNPEAALPLAQKAVDKATNKWEFLNTLGVVLYRSGQYEQAIEILERSLREGNNQAAAFDLYFLAMAHAGLGNAAKAKDCYNRAVKWIQEHQDQITPEWKEELTNFRAEADAVLANLRLNSKK
jgi:serine/threonine protein kinase/WD40 repeat protein/Tfp pilus assembly protein PilF